MRNITSEHFLSQSQKAQNVIKNNIQFEKGDYFYNTKEEVEYTYKGFYSDKYQLTRSTWETEDFINLDDFIPLLSETQLRQFIEDKTNSKIEMDYSDFGYMMYLCTIKGNGKYAYNYGSFEKLDSDLLQAYFQVACRIAEGN